MIDQAETLDAANTRSGENTAKSSAAFCLIVDDEPALRTMLSRALRLHMVMTEECGDAPSALRAITHRVPDLIFLDVSLERSDAVEVIRGLGEIKFSGSIQLMSGRDLPMLEDIRLVGERYDLKMLPVLQKPFRIDVIPGILWDIGIKRNSAPSAEIGLFEALCGGWLELCYQPKIDLRTRKLAGAEGLARVNHPKHGILTPESFLRDAEPASLLSLAEFAVLTALRDWDAFADAGAPLWLSVNVPVSALIKLPIAALVRDHRPKAPGWPGLILEIGEEQIIRDIPLVREFAAQLALYNIHIAVDRCGFARSSLHELVDLPHVELKLDRSFVVGCAGDPAKQRLCESVIGLAHQHERRVVAVGLDKPDDAKFFADLDCDLGQGTLLGPPLQKDRICQMLRIQSGRKPGS